MHWSRLVCMVLFPLAAVHVAAQEGWLSAPVEKTGQTTCFNTEGTQIDCGGTGQDGDLQAGVPHPTPHFTINGDGTVTDNLTGLTWLRDANCNGDVLWAEALEWANRLSDGCTDCGGENRDCGLEDGSQAGEWRLPNIKELQSLVTLGYIRQALRNTAGDGQWSDGDPFTGGCAGLFFFYHSSTTDLSSTSRAFSWDILNGTEFDWRKDQFERGWAVRGGDPANTSLYPAPVEKTGQKGCYGLSGVQMPCAGTGQDGEWQAGVAAPSPRFAENGDGTVTDHLTGLIWLRTANCDGQKNWSEALSWANGLFDGCSDCGGGGNDCGLTDGSGPGDWRLPNLRELQSLVNFGYFNPALANTAGDGQWNEGDPFTDVASGNYATSSTYLDSPCWNFYVNFETGYGEANMSKTTPQHVWPVRDGSFSSEPDRPLWRRASRRVMPSTPTRVYYWEGNGHWYEVIIESFTWEDARAAAEGRVWEGVNGHLATITTQEESDFIETTFGWDLFSSWLGGYQDPPDHSVGDQNWYWITGEPWEYTNWAPGEPNDLGGPEFYLNIHGWNIPQWNDVSDDLLEAFVVEYDAAPIQKEWVAERCLAPLEGGRGLDEDHDRNRRIPHGHHEQFIAARQSLLDYLQSPEAMKPAQ